MPFDGADRSQRENALAILEDVQAYLAVPGKWTRGAYSIHGRRHCVVGAVNFFGRRRKVPLAENLANGYLWRALTREESSAPWPEAFNDNGGGLPFVLELVASAIEIVRAELDGQPEPTAPRCPDIGIWYATRRRRDLGEPVDGNGGQESNPETNRAHDPGLFDAILDDRQLDLFCG